MSCDGIKLFITMTRLSQHRKKDGSFYCFTNIVDLQFCLISTWTWSQSDTLSPHKILNWASRAHCLTFPWLILKCAIFLRGHWTSALNLLSASTKLWRCLECVWWTRVLQCVEGQQQGDWGLVLQVTGLLSRATHSAGTAETERQRERHLINPSHPYSIHATTLSVQTLHMCCPSLHSAKSVLLLPQSIQHWQISVSIQKLIHS